jgi:hypothetical protein
MKSYIVGNCYMQKVVYIKSRMPYKPGSGSWAQAQVPKQTSRQILLQAQKVSNYKVLFFSYQWISPIFLHDISN